MIRRLIPRYPSGMMNAAVPALNGSMREYQFRRCLAFSGVIAPKEATAAG